MTPPSETETVALGEAGPLLRFAAEQVQKLDSDLGLAIAEARDAVVSAKWTPQVSQRFWAAFNALCTLIKPVTTDCLAAQHKNISSLSIGLTGIKWRNVSLAERSSSRYLRWLFFLLALILPLQLYVWIGSNTSKKIDDLLAKVSTNEVPIGAEFFKLNYQTQNTQTKTHEWTSEENQRVDTLLQNIAGVSSDLDRLIYEAGILSRMTRATGIDTSKYPAIKTEDEWWKIYPTFAGRSLKIKLDVINTQEASNLFIGVIISFILPILLGITGASAYVIRTISDQIKTSTFSQTSPIRHLMRAALGALAGVVVGLFSNLSSQLSLPPLALAFLAGYGVEALFLMFDGIIAKFK